MNKLARPVKNSGQEEKKNRDATEGSEPDVLKGINGDPKQKVPATPEEAAEYLEARRAKLERKLRWEMQGLCKKVGFCDLECVKIVAGNIINEWIVKTQKPDWDRFNWVESVDKSIRHSKCRAIDLRRVCNDCKFDHVHTDDQEDKASAAIVNGHIRFRTDDEIEEKYDFAGTFAWIVKNRLTEDERRTLTAYRNYNATGSDPAGERRDRRTELRVLRKISKELEEFGYDYPVKVAKAKKIKKGDKGKGGYYESAA